MSNTESGSFYLKSRLSGTIQKVWLELSHSECAVQAGSEHVPWDLDCLCLRTSCEDKTTRATEWQWHEKRRPWLWLLSIVPLAQSFSNAGHLSSEELPCLRGIFEWYRSNLVVPVPPSSQQLVWGLGENGHDQNIPWLPKLSLENIAVYCRAYLQGSSLLSFDPYLLWARGWG